MKTLFSLLTLVSLVMGQFSIPVRSVSAQSSDVTATPTETATEPPILEPTTTPVASPADVTATPSATATPPVEEAPTASPTETSTTTATPAATGTISSTETVTATPTSTPSAPVLSLRLTPDFSTPNGKINLHWEITGAPAEHEEFTLNFTFPTGASPELLRNAVFDEATCTLTMTVTNNKGQFAITAQGILENTFITASVFDAQNKLAEGSVLLYIKERFEIASAGGEIQAKGGRIKLNIPADTFSADTTIEIGAPGRDTLPAYSLSGSPFEISAKDKGENNDLHQLGKSVEIHISYAELDIPEEKLVNLFLYWYNPQTQEWEALPSFADPETRTLTSFTDHFSVFDVGINQWQAARMPTVDSFQVSQFTGAGTFSLPIEVPQGPGGLQPGLSLSYNSQVVDQSTTSTQASWVGMGWSLETGSIEVDTAGTAYTLDDTYFLNVAGVSVRLVHDAAGVFHAADENFWKFDYDDVAKTWTVWDKTGNKYYFENKISQRYLIDCDPGPNGGGGDASDPFPYKWVLTRVENIYHQVLTYTYVTETKLLHGNTTTASRIA